MPQVKWRQKKIMFQVHRNLFSTILINSIIVMVEDNLIDINSMD